MIVYAVPFKLIRFPKASEDESNLRFQKPSLIITTGDAPNSSSAARNVRPSTGCTPSNGKKLADIISAGMRSDSASPVKLKLSGRYMAKESKEWLSCVQSRKFG